MTEGGENKFEYIISCFAIHLQPMPGGLAAGGTFFSISLDISGSISLFFNHLRNE